MTVAETENKIVNNLSQDKSDAIIEQKNLTQI